MPVHRAAVRSRRGAVLAAAALTAMIMASCGSDDDGTPRASSTDAAATTQASPSTPAPSSPAAPATSSSPADSNPETASNCPVTAKEVSQRMGLAVHAIRPAFAVTTSCTFGPVGKCPCGPTKYKEVTVTIAGGLPVSVEQRRAALEERATTASRNKLIDRSDLGKNAFVFQQGNERGRAATLPDKDGMAIVIVAIGLKDDASRQYAARDARAANSVITLAGRRLADS